MATLPIRPREARAARGGRSRLARPRLRAGLLRFWPAGPSAQAPTVDTSVPALPGGSDRRWGRLPAQNSAWALARAGGAPVRPTCRARAESWAAGPARTLPRASPPRSRRPGGSRARRHCRCRSRRPSRSRSRRPPAPLYGTLEIPTGTEDDGPPDGLTLEQAIDVTLERSLDLRQKFYRDPHGARRHPPGEPAGQPVFYQDGQLLQYKGQPFSRARPGGPQQFDTNITYPLDISHKRQARTMVADPRREGPRGAVPGCRPPADRRRLRRLRRGPGCPPDGAIRGAERRGAGRRSPTLTRAALQERRDHRWPTSTRSRTSSGPRGSACVDARGRLSQGQAGPGIAHEPHHRGSRRLELRGRIEVEAPPPPPLDELRQIALADGPTSLSFRLGVSRAQADVRLARANAYSDVYRPLAALYLPGQQPLRPEERHVLGPRRDRPAADLQPQPGRDRAGQDQRDSVAASSSPTWSGRPRSTSRRPSRNTRSRAGLVEELRRPGHPRRQGRCATTLASCWQAGRRSILDYLHAQLDYNDIVKQYLDTAIRHRQQHAVAQYGGRPADHALTRIGSGRDEDRSDAAATAGRRRWDAEFAAACGRTWSCSSAGSCSPRSPTSWPPTASTRATMPGGPGSARRGRRRGRRQWRVGQLELRLVHRARRLDAQSGPAPQCRRLDQQHGPGPHRDPETRTAQARAVHGAVRRAVQRRARPDQHPGDPDLDPGRRDRQHDVAHRHPDPARHPEGLRASRSAASARSSTATSTPIRSSGFDLAAPQQNVDRGGRPNHIPTVTIDVNMSSGVYVESMPRGP